MGLLGEAQLNTTTLATTHVSSPFVLSTQHRLHASLGWPWGSAGEELLGATLFGTASRRPNRGGGPRAAAKAAQHNVTKQIYLDAGHERALEAASRNTRQAGASTSRRHWPWTRRSRWPRVYRRRSMNLRAITCTLAKAELAVSFKSDRRSTDMYS
jgi:hypothetical protein